MDNEREKDAILIGDWIAVSVQCPFWHGVTDRAIVCEGLERGESIRRQFRSREKMKERMCDLCCNEYKKCRIFSMLEQGYMEE